jgi:hypothetical protein
LTEFITLRSQTHLNQYSQRSIVLLDFSIQQPKFPVPLLKHLDIVIQPTEEFPRLKPLLRNLFVATQKQNEIRPAELQKCGKGVHLLLSQIRCLVAKVTGIHQ